MNIFYLDSNTNLCAKYHVDKHVIKMILETCQLLSTAHRLLDGTESTVTSATGRKVKKWLLSDWRESTLYSATHNNHPSAVWCRKSKANYLWLARLNVELCVEYTYRYGKVHKCESSQLVESLLSNVPNNISNDSFTEPTPAMPDDCKVKGNSIKSYRNYYFMNKQHLSSWKGKINSREVPDWFYEMEMKNAHVYV